MFLFRRLRLTHIILASLLWCAAAFVFAGTAFARFDTALRYFKESRYTTVLTTLKQSVQLDIDKGATLPQLKKTDAMLSRYVLGDKDILSLFTVDFGAERISASTLPAQTGQKFDPALASACEKTESFLIQKKAEKTFFGTAITDSSNTPVGCLCLEYTEQNADTLRDQAVDAVIHAATVMAVTGILMFATVYFLIFGLKLLDRPLKKNVNAFILTATVILFSGAVPFTVSDMNTRLDAVLKETMTLKTKTLSRILQFQIQKTLEAGVPLKFLANAEPFLDNIKQKHPEIVFILITDEAGRVLYESGQASNAFKTDRRTGKVTLRDGYGNAAEPLRVKKGAQGWIQIGIKERYGRDTLL